MTILAGFSSSRQGSAAGDKIIATAIVERPWRPDGDPVDDEYFQYVTSQASRSLERVVSQLPADLDIRLLSINRPLSQEVWWLPTTMRILWSSGRRPLGC